MIEKLRNTLEIALLQRENEIDHYNKSYRAHLAEFNLPPLTKMEASECGRKCLARLMLGLPFDQFKQRINTTLPTKNIHGLLGQITEIKSLSKQCLSLAIQIKNLRGFGLFKNLLNDWVNAAASSGTKEDRVAFCDNQISKELKNRSIKTFADLGDLLLLCEEQIIRKNPKSKKTYLGYLSSIYRFIVNPFTECQMLHVNEVCPAFLIDILVMLEKKTLKSVSIRPYKHLFLCYALIFAPIKTKQLFKLPAPDQENLCLRNGDLCFPVSQPFIDLWKCFGESKYLFHPDVWDEFNVKEPEKPLNQITKGWSRNAGLLFNLTPRMIRSSIFSKEVER